MYFNTTTANGRSETKAVGDTFTEPILMMYIYGYNCLLRYVLYIHKAYYCMAYSCNNKFTNYDFQK